MSYPTQPAFVVNAKGWDTKLLQHPMMQFLHLHNLSFDAKDFEACQEFYADDLVYIKSNGEKFESAEAAVAAMTAEHALFREYAHEPVYGIVVDHEDGNGHRLIGTAKLFVNLEGPFAGEAKYTDLNGRKWECVTQGSFIFDVVNDEEGPGGYGYRLKLFHIMADPTPILKEAIRRGVLPVDAILA